MAHADGHTDILTNSHGDSMTYLAQRGGAVDNLFMISPIKIGFLFKVNFFLV